MVKDKNLMRPYSLRERILWASPYMFLRVRQEAGIFNRLSALEARASKRAQLIQMLYLPLIFLVYGTLLGTVYFQNSNPTFILSAFGVFSCASGLFMFPAIYTYLFRAIEVSIVHYTNMLYIVGKSLSELMHTTN